MLMLTAQRVNGTPTMTMQISEPEHIQQLRETLMRFVDKEIPRQLAMEWDRDDTMPRDFLKKLADLGLTGMTVPEEYGGYGRDIHATMAAIEEISKRSLGAAGFLISAACYGAMNIVESGSAEQKAELLPKIVSGDLMFAYGLTEPDVGADLASVKTRVRRDGDKLIINGAKRFCTGAVFADYIFTFCRTEEDLPRYKNLNMILVPKDSPGVTVTPMDAISQRGMGTTDVVFENVEVPVSSIVGGESNWNQGWGMLAGPVLDVEKLEVAAMALGAAEAALADAWQYSQDREQFGVPICVHQSVRHRLAKAKSSLLAARLTLYHAADLADNDQPCGVETSIAKYFVAEQAQEVVLACQRVMGAYGCVNGDGGDMFRYVRESLVIPIAGGSSDIQLNNIANRLGLPRK